MFRLHAAINLSVKYSKFCLIAIIVRISKDAIISSDKKACQISVLLLFIVVVLIGIVDITRFILEYSLPSFSMWVSMMWILLKYFNVWYLLTYLVIYSNITYYLDAFYVWVLLLYKFKITFYSCKTKIDLSSHCTSYILFVTIYAFAMYIIICYRWSQNTYVSFHAVAQNWNWNDEKI